MTEPDWTAALCAQTDPDLFTPAEEHEVGHDYRSARRVCDRCPIRDACLQWALETKQRGGLWGGKSDRQRIKISRERERVA